MPKTGEPRMGRVVRTLDKVIGNFAKDGGKNKDAKLERSARAVRGEEGLKAQQTMAGNMRQRNATAVQKSIDARKKGR